MNIIFELPHEFQSTSYLEVSEIRKYWEEFDIGFEHSLVPSLFLKNKILVIAVKVYIKADICAFSFCLIFFVF